jgi:hypothetical protein
MHIKKNVTAAIALFIIMLTALILLTNVDNELYSEDIDAINNIMDIKGAELVNKDTLDYFNEIKYILLVQSAVLTVAPENKGIPENQSREPQDLLKYRYGLCYDRSRTIEKILRASGFQTRHISIFSLDEVEGSKIKACTSKGVESHAISEVLTKRGWLLIDSNSPWVALDKDSIPFTVRDVREVFSNKVESTWINNYELYVHPLYKKKFTYIYGLYSRHGKFYAPFISLPDVSWVELYYNF